VAPRLAAAQGPARKLLTDEGVLFWFLAAHVALGALVFMSPVVAKAHFWVTAALGLWFATSTKRPSDIAMLAAYVVGAEVLWRMSDAALFWETGKYAVVGLLLIGLARFPHTKPMRGPVLYFTLLTLGIVPLTQTALDFSGARQAVSFNLSGPLALAAAACFFRQCTLSREQLGQVLIAAAGPVVSIAILTARGTYGASDIAFLSGSNFQTSGGFGPNQVSGALSAGAFMCFLLLATLTDLRARRRGMLFATMVFCSMQSAMTFSRSGLYLVGIAALGASLCLFSDRSSRRMVVGTALAVVIAYAVVAPMLISFTGGALEERFRDPGMTGRVELTQDDLQIWADRPVFGVGVGQARSNRTLGNSGLTHNEWTRLLAEHGVFGLTSMLVLLAMMAGSILRARGPIERAVVVGLVLWGAAFLAVNEMRIVAPSFLMGLACATFEFSHGSRAVAWRRRGVALRTQSPIRT